MAKFEISIGAYARRFQGSVRDASLLSRCEQHTGEQQVMGLWAVMHLGTFWADNPIEASLFESARDELAKSLGG